MFDLQPPAPHSDSTKSCQTSTIRKGSVAPIPACRPPGPGRRDDHRVPSKHRRYDQSEYEPFWGAAEVLDLRLSLHRAIRTETSRNRAIASSDAWRARPGSFASDIGSNCSVYPFYDDRIRRPASSSISLTHAPCITSTCIVRPACRMRFVISCIVLTTSGWSGWPG